MNDNQIMLAVIAKVRKDVRRLIKSNGLKYITLGQYNISNGYSEYQGISLGKYTKHVNSPNTDGDFKHNIIYAEFSLSLSISAGHHYIRHVIGYNRIRVVINRYLHLQLFIPMHSVTSPVCIPDETTGLCTCPQCRPINLDTSVPGSLNDFNRRFVKIAKQIECSAQKIYELAKLDEEFFLNIGK